MAEQLLLVPFFITAWGTEYYGEWLTLTIIPSVLGFSDFGFGTAAANTFVLRYASGDKQGAANIAKAGNRIINLVVLSVLVVSTLTLLLLKYLGVFNNSLISPNDAVIAVSFLIAAKLLNFYQQLYDAFYRAERKAALSRHLLNIYGFLVIIIGIVVLKLGGNIIAFAFSNFIIALFFNPIYIWMSIKRIASPEFAKAKIVKEDVRETFKIGMGYMLAPAWQTILFQGSTLVVRLVLGPTAVAVYNTVRTLSRSVNQIFTVINSSALPEIQYEIGVGNVEKAKKLFLSCMVATFVLACLGSILLWFFGLDFYHLWTKNELNPPKMMWLFFVLSIIFNASWWTGELMFLAMNKPFKIHISGLFLSILSIVSVYFLSKNFDLNGAAFGALLFEFAMFFTVLPFAAQLIKLKKEDVLKYILAIKKN
ncbi:MATE family efflux transporter [uncultured Chryseobacterium sp.]|uniref:lipopolysaccharide biosynthesis protein n=1 Tax=uncultured Chryseobacterium sp. TaxID=259322 RepID=UPI002602633A|nr:MATE family efflux transporter [uncultured Chryseobacterium sp.]